MLLSDFAGAVRAGSRFGSANAVWVVSFSEAGPAYSAVGGRDVWVPFSSSPAGGFLAPPVVLSGGGWLGLLLGLWGGGFGLIVWVFGGLEAVFGGWVLVSIKIPSSSALPSASRRRRTVGSGGFRQAWRWRLLLDGGGLGFCGVEHFIKLERENQLKVLNMPAVNTIQVYILIVVFLTEYGDKYDCVDFYNQPGFDHPLLNNHSFYFTYAVVRTRVGAGKFNGAGAAFSLHQPKDLANGNWWLRIGDDNTPIGFWPKRIFRDLADSASYVDWGGVVYSPPGTPAPVMGSGHFLNRDTKYDAFLRNIQVVNDFGQNVDTFNTETFNDIGLYDVADIKNAESFGHLVLYGGPPQ
ncbi:hypothetical protein RHMOL_Rhmol02G0277000 [Rhododendron molle]|uniref:Uncharacterized protein n=1 Tax=Rhododendron molle TaxID=49168 RepID=A0ACC0PV90_RHOML|nr:hypothetical protein RHMOL_Rhmol02G0277000 [Rhododendron molle]